jgi:hypothetical protein
MRVESDVVLIFCNAVRGALAEGTGMAGAVESSLVLTEQARSSGPRGVVPLLMQAILLAVSDRARAELRQRSDRQTDQGRPF